MDAFGSLKHNDFARGFGASHIFDHQVIDANAAQTPDTNCCAFFDQCGCASDHVGVASARLRRVYNDGVRAGEVLQMEPHGVLWRALDERVILGLIRAYINFIVAVENLGIHVYCIGLCVACYHYSSNKFKSIFIN